MKNHNIIKMKMLTLSVAIAAMASSGSVMAKGPQNTGFTPRLVSIWGGAPAGTLIEAWGDNGSYEATTTTNNDAVLPEFELKVSGRGG